VTGVPVAHLGGLPIEETLGLYGPALLVAAGAASASLHARLRNLRARRRSRGTRERQVAARRP
jgi:hypothetical protein